MSSNHDQTANAIAAKKGVPYNQGKGPDIKGPRQIIEVESTETIKDAGRQLRGYRGPVYVAGSDDEATQLALERYEDTTIGVMDSDANILKSSSRKR